MIQVFVAEKGKNTVEAVIKLDPIKRVASVNGASIRMKGVKNSSNGVQSFTGGDKRGHFVLGGGCGVLRYTARWRWGDCWKQFLLSAVL